MKKVLLFAAFAVFGLTQMNAQAVFGLTAGYLSASSKVESDGFEATGSDGGFFGGVTVDFEISEKFHIQPELHYASVDDVSFLRLPIFAKYYVGEKFYLSGGPSLSYTLEDVLDDFTKMNIGLGLGLGYDFTEQFYIDSKAALQLNNYYTGSEDFKSKVSFVTIGVGYKFN